MKIELKSEIEVLRLLIKSEKERHEQEEKALREKLESKNGEIESVLEEIKQVKKCLKNSKI